ncbi:MAG: UPF0182 family protein [Bacillota bacterium]|nr:UPF0182 family protein [Bacillota bacterium]
MRRGRVPLLFVLGIGLAVAALSVFISNLYTDWLWFSEVGYPQVFLKTLWARVSTGFVGSTLLGAFLLANLMYARRVPSLSMVEPEDRVEPILEVGQRRLSLVCLVISSLAAWGFSLFLMRSWLVVQRYLNAVDFGYPDPIYSKDVGFYVFKLPFYSLLYQSAFLAVFGAMLACALIYLSTVAIGRLRGAAVFHRKARLHLFALLSLALAIRACGYQLDIWRLVYSPRGVIFGASYTDIHAELPALRILAVLSVLVGLVVLLTAGRRSMRPAFLAVAVLLISSVALRQGFTTLVQRVVVSPDEIAKEKPFIENNIRMTLRAFGLENVIERPYSAVSSLTRREIDRNSETLSNVRLWDWRPLKQTFSQLQEMRLYYTFNDVDTDRYTIDGKYRQMCLAVREMNQENLADQAKTWINKHLKFTHGYGLVMSPANEVGQQGLPIFTVKDIPPNASPGLTVTRPAIYFGELTSEYVIVGTREDEFDYPLGDQNVLTQYDGTGGIPTGSILRRLAFALRFRDYEILLSRAITSRSRILFNRDLTTRASTLAPFLLYDQDPYPVIDDGRVTWIYDAYTATSDFPYSEPSTRGFNYIRNSVKATIDAYNGDITFYLFDTQDALVRVYARIFPGMFKPYEAMPEGLKRHIRYPADLFETQAEMYITYHMQDPMVFYNKEDLWGIPPHGKEGHEMKSESYHMILRLPGETSSEYISLMAFTPFRKQNMIAWLAARSDVPNYGQFILFKFPKEHLVFGPTQIDARIDQDADISPKLTLWGQLGSRVIRGNLRVIPVDGSILYIEPLYLQATENRLPELKRVLVSYGDRVVMEDTLDKAIAAVFGAPAAPAAIPQPGEANMTDLVKRAMDLYNEAKVKSQAGDWAGYGKALDELGRVLRQISERTEERR